MSRPARPAVYPWRAAIDLTNSERPDCTPHFKVDHRESLAASIASFAEVDHPGEAGIPLYFIAYQGSEDQAQSIGRMKDLAAEAGGFVAIATQQNLAAKHTENEKDVRAQFAIRSQIMFTLAEQNDMRARALFPERNRCPASLFEKDLDARVVLRVVVFTNWIAPIKRPSCSIASSHRATRERTR